MTDDEFHANRQVRPAESALFTEVTSTRGPWIRGALSGAAVAAIAAWQIDGPFRWVCAVALLVLAAPVNALLNPPEALWLEDDVLVHRVRTKESRIDLSQPVYVSRSFVPKKGVDLLLDGANGVQISIWMIGPQTEAIRRVIGKRDTLRTRGTGLLDAKTKKLLLRE
jgi:hypothetical protein